MNRFLETDETPPLPLKYVAKESKDYQGKKNYYYRFFVDAQPYLVAFWYGPLDRYISFPEEFHDSITVDESGRGHIYELRFGKEASDKKFVIDNYELTGEGKARVIMATVKKAVHRFLTTHHDFTALEYSSYGKGRTKAYKFLTALLSRTLKLKTWVKENESKTTGDFYVFTKDKVHTEKYIPEEDEEDSIEYGDEEEEEEENKIYMVFLEATSNTISDQTLEFYLHYSMKSTELDYDEDSEWLLEDDGLRSTQTSITFDRIGIDRRDSPYSDDLLELKKFNPFNGHGLLIQYSSYTGYQIYKAAKSYWVGREFYDRGEPEEYFTTEALENLTEFCENDKIDYVMVFGGENPPELDSIVSRALENVFPVLNEYYTLIHDETTKGPFSIYCRDTYDYSMGFSFDNWSTTSGQRTNDRQIDLPFGF